jgi:DNA-binding MltR family transcriptional regulator
MKPPDERSSDPTSEWWELPDIREFYDESPDRGIAISLPAIIDDRLTSILKLVMLDNKKLLNEFFTPGGSLSNFGTKINLVYMLGIVDEEVYRDLSVINKIRNKFAHRVDIKRLEQQPIKDLIANMGTYQALVRISKSPHNPIKEGPMTDQDKFVIALARTDLTNMRWTFRSCMRMMIIRLNAIAHALTEAQKKAEEQAKQKVSGT